MKDAGVSISYEWQIQGHADSAGREFTDGAVASVEELDLVNRLRQGDEQAFTSLVDRYHASLVRLALAHVSDRSVAEEVVQESWIGVLEGLDRFAGRSSLKTWIFRIVSNKAKTRGVRESRHTTFSDCGEGEEDFDEPAVDPARFRTSGHWVDYWSTYPQPWDEETPEKCLLTKEGSTYLEQAIQGLPSKLKQILILRDVEGIGSKEVCGILGVSETNQRVLLHRARAKVRQALDVYVTGGTRSA
jgi:RNA polymerase sigma-70 factor, ECF subfamily